MNQREKRLAMLFGGILLLWWGQSTFRSWFLDPLAVKRTEIQTARDNLDEKLVEQAAAVAADRQIQRLALRALPNDPLAAQRQYQKWLTDLIHIHGFQSSEIVPVPLGRSSTVGATPVKITVQRARASYEQICRFLLAFENAAVLHRISNLKLTCDEHRGNPQVEITFTAEALAMPLAKNRESVLPQFRLSKPLGANDLSLEVSPAPVGFPEQAPFRVRIDREWVDVVKIDGKKWTLARGVDHTTPAEHPVDAEVELFRLRSERLLIPEQELQRIVAENFFLKPKPPVVYTPRLAPIGDREIVLTTPSQFTLQATGFAPDAPPRRFDMRDDIPEGLTIDEQTGRVTWTPTESTSPGQYFVTFDVYLGDDEEPILTESTLLSLVNPNRPPVISSIEPMTAIAGTELTFRVSARDEETPADRLTFALAGTPPEGAVLNARTGVFTWTPPENARPAELELTVTVTDAGVPPETATRTVTVSLIEDLTRDIFLTGILTRGDNSEAMLYNRAENVTFVLKPGFPFNAAGVRGQVLEIGRDFVVWRSGDDRWRLILGENLRARVKQPRTVATAPSDIPGSIAAQPLDRPLVAPNVPSDFISPTAAADDDPLVAPKP